MKGFLLLELVLYTMIIYATRADLFGTALITVVFGLVTMFYLLTYRIHVEDSIVRKSKRDLRLMKQYEYGFGNCL